MRTFKYWAIVLTSHGPNHIPLIFKSYSYNSRKNEPLNFYELVMKISNVERTKLGNF